MVDARKGGRGGRGGGGAKLTPEGQALLKYYEEILEEMNQVASKWSQELTQRFRNLTSYDL